MAYQINKTDGTVLTTVADGQVDRVSTDITLIGKNYSGFGEALNENLVKMLENFADSVRPERPLKGQLWFDTTDLKLKIYNGTQFLPVSSATLSKTQPSSLSAGDLWYDQTRGQLFFFDGNALKLLGPEWSTSQGQTGLISSNVFDNSNTNRVVSLLYVGGVLLGVFSKDTFSLRTAIPGYPSQNIISGFNSANLPGLKFDVTTTNSEKLGGVPATSYIKNNDPSTIVTGSFNFQSTDGLTIGDDNQLKITFNGDNSLIQVKRISLETAVVISPSSRTIEVYPDAPFDPNNINGSPSNPSPNVQINGNLNVEGEITAKTFSPETLNPINSTVENKNFYLAVPDVPGTPFEELPFSDTLADGGGIILKGDNDHSLTWTTESSAWNSTEHINLVSSERIPTPEYKIDGVTVLNANSLGPTITSAPGITNFGTQDLVTIGREVEEGVLVPAIKLQATRIEVLETNGNLELKPNGTGSVAIVGGSKITGLGDPAQNQDAATKKYVDDSVANKTVLLSIDLSDNKSNSYIITNILNNMIPPQECREGTVARLLCTIKGNLSQQVNANLNLNITSEVFSKPLGTGLALTGVTLSPITIPGPAVSLVRIVKTFTIIGGQWTFGSDTTLPT